MIQDNFYYLLSLIAVILFLVILYLAHALYHTIQQIKSTAKAIEEMIRKNQGLFDNLNKLTEQLNEQVAELSPAVKQLNEFSKKLKDRTTGIFNMILTIAGLAGGSLGRVPLFFAGLRWMLKKFKRGGK